MSARTSFRKVTRSSDHVEKRASWLKRPAAEVLESRIAPAAVLSATKVDMFAPGGDVNGDGNFDPGDTILYTVTITNAGDVDLTGVTFQDLIDANTTLGLMNASPLARNDLYTAQANTQLVVGSPTVLSGVSASSSTNPLANDSEFFGDAAVGTILTSFQSTSAQGGSVAMITTGANAGSFTYVPAPGFTGLDTFTYALRDDGFDGIAGNGDDLSSVGTISISVVGTNNSNAANGPVVWYVDSAYAGANGAANGTSARPFTTLTTLNVTATDPDEAGDTIYVVDNGVAYTGGITLEASQTLIGEGNALIVNTITLAAAGPVTMLNGGVTLGSGNTLRGFTAGAAGTAISGTSFGTLDVLNVTINNPSGAGLSLTTGSFASGSAFNSITSTGGTNSIALTGVNGTGSIGLGGGALSGASGAEFFVSGGNAQLTYSGTITNTAGRSVDISTHATGNITLSGNLNDTGTGVSITNNTSGTIAFTGSSKVINTGTNTAVTYTGNGASFQFIGGGLDIDTTSGTGINASGNTGAFNVTGTNNTINSASGATALNVANTVIGALGLTFQSIISNGGSASGIILDTTGSSGGLTVTGTGTAGSGGSISNKTGAGNGTDGVFLRSTMNVSLARMTISDNNGNGIFAGTVNGFKLDNMVINSNGDSTTGADPLGLGFNNEANVHLVNISGTAIGGSNPTSITNSTITNAFEHDVEIDLTTGTLTDFQINSSSITNNGASTQAGTRVLFINNGGTGTLTVQDSTISGNRSAGALTAHGIQGTVAAGTMNVKVFRNSLLNNAVGVDVSTSTSGILNFDIADNGGSGGVANNGATNGKVSGSQLIGISVFTNANSTGSVNGFIRGNTVGTQGVVGSGSAEGRGIQFQNEGSVNSKVQISGNIVQSVAGNQEINVQHGIAVAGAGGTSNVTITNNILRDNTSTSRPLNAEILNSGVLNLLISGNSFSNNIGQGGGASLLRVNEGTTGSPTLNVTQLQPTAAANANELDDANGLSFGAGQVTVAGTPNFGTAAPQPPVAFLEFAPEVVNPGTEPSVVEDVPPVAIVDDVPVVVQPPLIIDDGILSQAELDSLVNAAIARWDASGLTAEQSALLRSITFSVADLPGWYLGAASGTNITLDADAAGNAWFIDTTPLDDSEFVNGQATANGGAYGRVDALTTIAHELGHVLGLGDSYASIDSGSLMYGFIGQGERRVTTAGLAAGVVPHGETHDAVEYINQTLTIGALGIGKSVTVQFRATVNTDIAVNTVINQGTVDSDQTAPLLTDGNAGVAGQQPTVTAIDLPDVSVAMTTTPASESAGALVYTFSRTGLTSTPLMVNFGASGTAVLADYTATSGGTLNFGAGTVVIPAGNSSVTVTLTPVDDRQVEGSETATLTVAAGGYDITGSPATGTINDNDTATISFTTGTSTGLEGAGTQNIGTTLTINATGTGTIGIASNFTANLTTTGGTATGSGTDYTLPGTPAVTFLATADYSSSSATQNAAVTIIDDRQVEGTETAALGLSIVTNIGTQVSLGGTTAHTLTITDNDTATLSFTTGTSTGLESAGTQNISTTLTISALGTGTIGLASNLTANLSTTGGTATGAGTDYTLPGSPAVTFAAGTYATGTGTQNAAVALFDDRQVEGSETAGLGLSIVTNIGTQVTVGGTTAHTLTITDNDTATIGFTTGTGSASEGAGTQNVSTTLTINALGTGTIGLASNLTANLTTTGGSATGTGTDYTLPASPAVTFAAGAYASGTATQNAAVTLINDRLVEGDETAGLGLSIVTNIGTQVTVGGTTGHSLTLIDNDTASLSFTTGSSTAQETAGTQIISTTLTISALGTGTIGLASNVTANFTNLAGGSATGGGVDYTLPASPAVTFLASADYSSGSATQTAAVALINDATPEGSETANLGLSIVQNIATQVSVGGTSTHTLTIQDTAVSVTVGTTPVLESSTTGLIYTFTRTGDTSTALPINFTKGGTATLTTDFAVSSTASTFDYNAGTLTIPAGASSVTVTLVPVDDVIVEPDETAILTVAAGTGYAVTGSAATGTFTDNDSATVTIAKITDGAEGATPTAGKFRVTQSVVSTTNTVLAYTITGTATNGTDYTTLTGSVTILAGQATADIDVAVLNDAIVESTETVIATLNTITAGDPQITVGGANAATVNIADDDTDVNLAIGATTSVVEDGAGNLVYTFTRVGQTSGALTVFFTVSGGAVFKGNLALDSDYTQTGASTFSETSGGVIFAAGSSTATVTITPRADTITENNETVVLTLNSGPGYNIAATGSASGTGTIVNDDTTVFVFGTPGSVAEDTGSALTYTFKRAGVLSTGLTINLNVAGTANFPTDYSQTGAATFTATTGTLTFAPGSDTATIALNPIADAAVEPTETAQFTIASGTGYTIDPDLNSLTGLILNDDASVSVAINVTPIAEDAPGGNFFAYTFTRTGFIGNALTVNFTASGTATKDVDYGVNGASFIGQGGTVTFAPNSTTAIVTVDPTADAIAEADESVIFTINAGTGYSPAAGPDNAASGTISNDDTAVSVAVTGSPIAENAAAGTVLTYTFTRSGENGLPLTVNFSAGGSASFANDYSIGNANSFNTGTGLGTVTFLAGSSTASITLTPNNDTLVEGTEDAVIFVNTGSGYGVGASPAFGQITDNDTATVTFASLASSVAEGGTDSVVVTFTTFGNGVQGAGTLQNSLTINVADLGGGTATAGGVDHNFNGQSLTFPAGEDGLSIAFFIPTADDTISEGNETFRLGLTPSEGNLPQGITLGSDPHVATILDNDVDLRVTAVGAVGAVVAGSGAGNVTFTFTVQNTGLTDATDISLSELFTLPTGVTISSSSTTAGSIFNGGNSGGTWSIPALAVNGSTTLTLSFTAASSAAAGATVLATSTVASAAQTLTNTNDDSDTASGAIIRQSDLAVSMTDSPDPVGPGQVLTYTITVFNAGPSDNTLANVSDLFPLGFSNINWTSSVNGFPGSSGTGNVNVPAAIPAQGSLVVTVTGTVAAPAYTTLSNTATITSAEDTNLVNNSDTETTFIGGVDLKLTKSADAASAVPGQVIEYTLTYRNGGFITANGVKIEDLIPLNTVFDLANSTAGWQDGSGNALGDGAPASTNAVFPLGSVPVSETGASVILAVRVTSTVAAGSTTVDNSANIGDNGAGGADLTPADNSAGANLTLIAAPDLVLTVVKDHFNPNGQPLDNAEARNLIARGQDLRYTYSYANVGNQDTSGVTIYAHVPTGTSFDPVNSNSGWLAIGGGNYAFNTPSLPAGATAGSVVFGVTVDQDRVPGLTEIASTARLDDGGSNGPDPTPANNVATTATTLYEGLYAVAPGVTLPRRGGPPVVRVFDIASGLQVHSIQAYDLTYRDSIRIAIGDINGDGFDDIITSTRTGTGKVRVFDGLTGDRFEGAFAEIAAFPEAGARGAFVATGDYNGDGRADIIVGSGQGARGSGKVRVFDGVTGGKIAELQPFATKFRGGVRVAAGDVNGDGVAEVIASQGFGGNDVAVFTGPRGSDSNPQELLRLDIGGTRYRGGVFVAAGDLDGDGRADLIVGRDRGPTIVETFNGGTGVAMDTFVPFALRYRLGARVAVADVNLDGIADIIVGAGGRGNSEVKIFNGVDQVAFDSFQAFPTHPFGALFVAAANPIPPFQIVLPA